MAVMEFIGGAGAAGVTGFVAWLGLRARRKEGFEERLQRWQTETVQAVREENKGLRGELANMQTLSGRLVIVESALRLVVVELMRLDPRSPVLQQVGGMLAQAIPTLDEIPDDMVDLLQKISAVGR